MKKIWQKWNEINLIKRILVFLVLGAVLGVVAPTLEWIGIFGTLFVGALKAVAPILVFFLVIAALTNARADGSMKTIVVLYILCTFIAALVAVIASYLFPIELTLTGLEAAENTSPEGVGEVLGTLVMNVVANPVDALVNANYLAF